MAAHGLGIHSTNILMAEHCVIGNAQRWRLTEAVRCHIGDTRTADANGRVFTDAASFPCCGRKVSSSFSNSVGEICRPVIFDPPAERGGGGSTHRDGSSDLFA